MLFWIVVGVVTVALVFIGLKDSDEAATRGAVFTVTLLFLGVVLWLWVSR